LPDFFLLIPVLLNQNYNNNPFLFLKATLATTPGPGGAFP